jgi:hypothetical protein
MMGPGAARLDYRHSSRYNFQQENQIPGTAAMPLGLPAEE